MENKDIKTAKDLAEAILKYLKHIHRITQAPAFIDLDTEAKALNIPHRHIINSLVVEQYIKRLRVRYDRVLSVWNKSIGPLESDGTSLARQTLLALGQNVELYNKPTAEKVIDDITRYSDDELFAELKSRNISVELQKVVTEKI